MAASVRIGQTAAATAPAASTGHGTSSAHAVTAAVVRIADVSAVAPVQQYVWDGQEWVPVAPGVALSFGTGRSSVHAASTSGTGTAASTATGRSQVSALVAFTGTLALSGGGTLSPSGAPAGPSDFVGALNLTGGGTLSLSGSALQGPPGAGSLTVIPDPGNKPPRMLLELTGALGTEVTITRVDQAGNQSPVRAANPATLSGGAAVVYDYEAPYNQTVRYVATTSGPTITSDPVTLLVSQTWLVHPGIPDLSQPLTGVVLGDATQDTNAGVFYALGRDKPAVVTDGARRADVFTATCKTRTEQDRQALASLLADSSVLLLQLAFPYTDVTEYYWVSIGQTSCHRRTLDFGDRRRLWTLPITVTDSPAGMLQSQRTWADVVGQYATWADVVAAYESWRDVLIDQPIGS